MSSVRSRLAPPFCFNEECIAMTTRDLVKDPHLEEQWNSWIEKNDPTTINSLSDNDLREIVIKDLTRASQMTVEEYTLFQKWCEIQDRYPTQKTSTLFGVETQMTNLDDKAFIENAKTNVWIPESPEDYLKLDPVMVYTGKSFVGVGSLSGNTLITDKDAKLSETWNCIRTFTSTMKNNSNIGRSLNYLVKDNKTGKYLGVVCISSDFLDLTPRDKYIGWERTKKTQGKMINYTAIGSTIVPFQPLGYNYVGGKLLALLCLSDEVQQQWKKQYGDVLIGVTTTSLYGKNKAGGLSQYDGLKHWEKMGFSSGSVSYETTKSTVYHIRHWLKKNHTRKYFEWYQAKKPSGQPYKRDHKNRSYTFTYSKLSVPKELIRSEHQRGIYFSPLYNNSCEFLKGEITENDLKKSFDTSYEALTNIWKNEYAKSRFKILSKKNKLSSETLFYDDLIYMTWEETKAKYLSQVGR